ncbi:bifunctional lysylphosphatidylglycerol flippase/synthetase MprF (plasmid) [Paroceanicella profunda]|uniref:Bifunctional lysylphosphatidylglycerol flippase/synthetase MprF n=1 Tax=Paroceanicella profunda TaxID=2579971 RepID=A0A5B8G646_9RHOB|nr:bifunctional lysylphosphatidylglycerol flippase/synthetase MprF [Paroceanicella profunda]QDL94553.1 bifunctional lysylphosphatidylglycerol flippase/synthetase MprF [Paroceanicella profunda]
MQDKTGPRPSSRPAAPATAGAGALDDIPAAPAAPGLPPGAGAEPEPAEGAATGLRAWIAAHRNYLLIPAILILLCAGGFALRGLAAEADYHMVVAALLATPGWRLGLAVGLTALSYVALTLYDVTALASLGVPRRWRDVAPGAFAAFAIAQSVGFGPLSGAAVRLRFYLPLGIGASEVARLVALVTFAFGLGLLLTAGLGAVFAASEMAPALGISTPLLQAVGAAAFGLALAVLALGGHGIELRGGLCRRLHIAGPVRLPGRGLLARQMLVAAADILAVSGVVWVLLPPGTISYPAFVPLFAVALTIGVTSHVPAGLGVFEAVLLAGLSSSGTPVSQLLAALTLYRLIYYAAPIILACAGVVVAEANRLSASPALRLAARAFAGLAPQLLAAFSLLLGAMLVFSAVTPARSVDLAWLARHLPLPLLEGAHFFASVLGAVLMLSARGLAYRLDGARAVALAAASVALVLSVLKAFALYEAAALALFILLLLAARRSFDRPAAILNQTLSPRWFAAIACVLVSALAILLFVHDHSEFGVESWARFELSAEVPRGLRALVGAGLVCGFAGLWMLLRPGASAQGGPASGAECARALAIAAGQPAAEAALLRLGDKRLMFSDDGRAFVMYGRQGRSWIALFGPFGAGDAWPGLVWDFVETARRAGGRAAFYQVTGDTLALYADVGLACLKIGEEARLDLTAFTLEGPAQKDRRYALRRGERDGLAVELLPRGGAGAVMAELSEISAAWLATRGGAEKGFSLGAFLPGYVLGQRVALLRRGEEILAFVTLMETGEGSEAAVDLMRHGGDMPAIGMEFLFLRLAQILSGEGLHWLGLGMAPLSGMSDSVVAPTWQRLGRVIYEHGSRFYNFKGLRGFKARFQPEWRARYLAVSGGLDPALVLFDAARLIAAGPQGAVVPVHEFEEGPAHD